jgi:hypothetical protein
VRRSIPATVAAFAALGLAAVAIVAAVVIGLVRLAGAPFGHDFAPNVD